ncbi:hypothetical protein F4802DRAFT_561792 [Xylaria palmicola]|nr:hypothetical protein F4802DRAFT_561792 [Xylaria palmicola]
MSLTTLSNLSRSEGANVHAAMMNRQPNVDGIVAVGHEVSSPSYAELASGESLLIACERGWSEAQSIEACTVRITAILRLIDNGQFRARQKPPAGGSLWESYGRVNKSAIGTSLAPRASQGSTGRPRLPHDTPTSFISSCPTLASGTSPHRNLAISHSDSPTLQVPYHRPAHSSPMSTAKTTETSALPPTEEELEPLVLASVRQVLASDPLYAEEVVRRLKELPVAQRNILFNQHWALTGDDTPATLHSSGDTTTPQLRPPSSTPDLEGARKVHRTTSAAHTFFRVTKSQPAVSGTGLVESGVVSLDVPGHSRQVPQGQASQARNGQRQPDKHRVQKLSGRKSKRKATPPDNNGDNQGDGGDGSGLGGGGSASTATGGQNKANIRWACPYCLAFTQMLGVAKFKSCRPPGSLNSRSLWKDHLREYHSPEARLLNSNADHSLFYMDDEPWERVQARIAGEKHNRPRQYSEWFEAQKQCFLDVWRIIFPRALYPHLNEPLSPFHPDSSSLASLGPRIGILLETIRETRARRAVETGSIETLDGFHPTHEQYMEMMTEALTIMVNASPGVAQWVINAPAGGLRAAVRDHSQITDRGEVESASFEAVLPPQSTLGPDPESNLSAQLAVPTMIPLMPDGTQIYLEVSPSYATEPSRRPALLQVTPPQGFYVYGMRIVPTSPSSLVADHAMIGTLPAPVLVSHTEPSPNHHFVDPSFL